MCDTHNLDFASSALLCTFLCVGCVHLHYWHLGDSLLRLAALMLPKESVTGMPVWYAAIQQGPFPESALELSQQAVIAQKHCLTKGSCTHPFHPKQLDTGTKACTECAVCHVIRAVNKDLPVQGNNKFMEAEHIQALAANQDLQVCTAPPDPPGAHFICHTALSSNHVHAEPCTVPWNQG